MCNEIQNNLVTLVLYRGLSGDGTPIERTTHQTLAEGHPSILWPWKKFISLLLSLQKDNPGPDATGVARNLPKKVVLVGAPGGSTAAASNTPPEFV